MTDETITATDLLRQQHQQVKSTFAAIESADADRRVELFDSLRRALAVHEMGEELCIHPEARKIGPQAAAVVEERLAEEAKAKEILAALEKLDPRDEIFMTTLREFRTAALAHAEAEEKELFPLLEANLPTPRLVELANQVRVAEDRAPTHPHPNAPDGALAQKLTGPFLAMADKVRDAIHEHQARKAG